MARTVPLSRGLAPALLLAGALGCGDDLLLPAPPSGEDLQVSIVGGNDQTGTVGEPLGEPLIVAVRHADGLPLTDWEVAFVVTSGPAAATVSPDTAVTDSRGLARSHWVLGTTPGSYGVEARVVLPGETDPPSARFTASALATAPDTLRAVSPLSQPGRREEELPEPVVVQVVDRYGNSLSDVPVRWEVTAGKGEVSDSATTTGTDGRASVRWTLGDRVGVQKLAASVEGGLNGSPVIFTATVLF
jgi:hypothetical protein